MSQVRLETLSRNPSRHSMPSSERSVLTISHPVLMSPQQERPRGGITGFASGVHQQHLFQAPVQLPDPARAWVSVQPCLPHSPSLILLNIPPGLARLQDPGHHRTVQIGPDPRLRRRYLVGIMSPWISMVAPARALQVPDTVVAQSDRYRQHLCSRGQQSARGASR
jgi:hypothetical protein